MRSGAGGLRCPVFERRALRSASRSLVRESLSDPRMDLIFLGVIVAFFGVTWGLAVLGDRLSTVSARGAEERVR